MMTEKELKEYFRRLTKQEITPEKIEETIKSCIEIMREQQLLWEEI